MLWSRTYTATRCNHLTTRKGVVTAFGESITTEMPKNGRGGYDYCLKCLGEMAIRCAWCEAIIFIGDPVTLYASTEGKANDSAVRYPAIAGAFVGCQWADCAESGADLAGIWVPDPGPVRKGSVQRVMSGIDQVLSGEHETHS